MAYANFYAKFENMRNENKDFDSAVIAVERKIDEFISSIHFKKFLHLFCINIKVDIKYSMSDKEIRFLIGHLNRKYLQDVTGDTFYVSKRLFSKGYRIKTFFTPNAIIF